MERKNQQTNFDKTPRNQIITIAFHVEKARKFITF